MQNLLGSFCVKEAESYLSIHTSRGCDRLASACNGTNMSHLYN